MKLTQVTAEYGRTVSDGNFGSERVGIILTATVEDGDSATRLAHDLTTMAKEIVSAQLRDARSLGVRRAMRAEAE